MEYRYLGSSGLQVSALSFGSWVTFGSQIGEDIAYDCMKAAYDAGVNFFDNAEVYAGGQAETLMGNVIKRAGWKRSDLVVSTKIFWGGKGPNDRGLSRKHVIEGTNAALARLQLDYVDLVFCHRPDNFTPIEETVRAMTYLVDQGKAFYWGTSEWSAVQIMEAVRHRAPRAPGPADHGAAAVQHVPPRAGRGRIRASLPGDRPGHDDLEPAGQRPADRQVQRRHARGHARQPAGLRVAAQHVRERRGPGTDRQGARAGPHRGRAGLHDVAAGAGLVPAESRTSAP